MIISRLKKFSEDGRNSRNASILKHGGTTAALLGLGTTLGSDIAYDRMSIPVFQKSIEKHGSDPQKGMRIAERYLRSNKAAKRLKNLKKAGMGLAALGAASSVTGSYLKLKQDADKYAGLK